MKDPILNNTLKPRFQMAVKGNNFITPDVVGYYEKGWYIIEVSTGYGFDKKPLWGVTVVFDQGNTPERRVELDKCFASRKEVIKYLRSL